MIYEEFESSKLRNVEHNSLFASDKVTPRCLSHDMQCYGARKLKQIKVVVWLGCGNWLILNIFKSAGSYIKKWFILQAQHEESTKCTVS
jgi:hypothetical protein